ncbi:translation factor [Delitschia confertaspora ATCC 74209]|uniref:Threonylcarbamoyl-AMP synthase n=1 Tax=Delitschia confertaspora ATCC 74209 TaxID=1513339 RepID=A0A9P4MRL5_9PLEO|nr:translation factor [Delitschia confertaspora ATCC 74209]
METDILPVSPENLGRITFKPTADDLVDEWHIEWANDAVDVQNLQRAAYELATTNNPVGFPTETVYGLGADATKGEAVRAIFQAKGRPADNPLIVHFSSIKQLRGLLKGRRSTEESDNGVQAEEGEEQDPIPEIYKPLIRKFWPGPLTIILPNPEDSLLAPEVTAGLNTFGARMPRSILALALIDMAGCPLAAPSANASTRPSPTAAEHVKDDLNGRIHTIIDGGPCNVGVESTVVDGLSSPPAILRPGGVTMEQLRQCPGWENVVVGYKDKPEHGIRPRAPGMKYRHYSPKAMVVLYETGATLPSPTETFEQIKERKSVGIIRTKTWPKALGLAINEHIDGQANGNEIAEKSNSISNPINTTEPSNSLAAPSNLLLSITQHQVPHAHHYALSDSGIPHAIDVWDIDLGAQADGVARGLFSALRELDKKGVDMIFVEGVDDREGGDIAAAVMNRLRKAAEVRI